MSDKKPKRLAIAISGAVSLGSYEAGVLYEVVRALGHHNKQAEVKSDPCRRIEIDVLTGASAGGMSAAILSQKLLYQAAELDGAETNALYLPWVVEADITEFLKLEDGEDPAKSILSSKAVEDIAKKFIPSQPGGGDRHAAAAGRIALGMALSNLSGVDLGARIQGGGDFGYTRFREEMLKDLDADRPPRPEEWDEIREVAVSCGAFPIAFRVKGLARSYAGDPRLLREPVYDGHGHLAFTDGGMFHNEPLKMAKDLVDRIDNHADTESRFYLYLSPHAKGTLRDETFKADGATIWKTAARLIAGIRGQAGYHDLLETEEINDQIALFDRRCRALADAVLADRIEIGVLDSASSQLLALFDDSISAQGAVGAHMARLRESFPDEVRDLMAKGERAVAAWLRSILVLEAAAGLCGRDLMRIYTITAEEEDLSGEQFHSFGGFFSQALRRNDYELGREMAQKWLRAQAGPVEAGGIGPILLPVFEQTQFDRDLARKTVREINPREARQFRDQVLGRLNMAMDSMTKGKWWHALAAPIRMGVRGIVRGWIDRQFAAEPGQEKGG